MSIKYTLIPLHIPISHLSIIYTIPYLPYLEYFDTIMHMILVVGYPLVLILFSQYLLALDPISVSHISNGEPGSGSSS